MADNTRTDDAASIVGEELAEELEKRSRVAVTRSQQRAAPGILVTKAENEAEADEKGEPTEQQADAKPEAGKGAAAFGGATTISDAEEWLLENGTEELQDEWWILKGVISNIVGSEAAEQVAKEIDAFRDVLELQALDALNRVAALAERLEEIAPQGEEPAPAKRETKGVEEEAAPAEVEQSLAKLRVTVTRAAKADQPDLAGVQTAMDDLGAAIKRSLRLRGGTATNEVDITALAQAVAEIIAPSVAAAAAAAVKPEANAATEQRRTIPAPRSARPATPAPFAQVQATVPVPTPAPLAGRGSRLRQVIRRSVGLEG